ncbi:MAG: hypothetical protein RI894_1973 [Bacteroidota bacterium]|jgi:L-threonylcarbamoyladenylate synthase
MFPELNIVLEALQNGKIILYPTDTIWGVGCDCTNEQAVQRVYAIKKRSDTKSLILLVDSLEMLQEYVPSLSGKVFKLHEHFTRPLTMIYSHTINLPDFLKADDGSIAIRIVQDPFCKEIIAAFGKPIVSTSANTSGKPSPKYFAKIELAIKRAVDYTVKHRQKDKTESEPSILARYHDETDELEVLRA